jgi:glycosyltransferase involved in cell wall biosynthesis
VLPTYNEAGNIARLVADLRRVDPSLHLLIVDDNSPDGTGGIADDLVRATENVAVLHRPGKLGLGSAHVAGLDRAVDGGYQTVVTMDCDYTHLPADVPKLLEALESQQADVAAGSRYGHAAGVRDWPVWRQMITKTAHFCTVNLLGIPFDATSAFRAYRTSALKRVPYRTIRGDGYSFIFEMLFTCVQEGLRIAEVPMEMPIRQAGQSKISRIEIVRALVTLMRLSSARAARQLKLLTSSPRSVG